MDDYRAQFEAGRKARELMASVGELTATADSLLEQVGQVEEQIPHGANLAEYLDDGYLGEISSDLRASYEEDLDSRSEWEET